MTEYPIKYCTIEGNIAAFINDSVDVGDEPDVATLTADVKFVSSVPLTDLAALPHAPGGPVSRLVRPIDGKVIAGEVKSLTGATGVKLWAADANTNPQVVYWTASFTNASVNGQQVLIDPFTFEAVPDAVLNVTEVQKVPGFTGSGVTRGEQGRGIETITESGGVLTITLDDDTVLPAVPLPGFVSALAAANAARDAAQAAEGVATTKAGEASTSASQALTYRNQAEAFRNQAETIVEDAAAGVVPDLGVSTPKLQDGAVTSIKIADGTIVDADINASADIAQSKINGLAASLAAKANDSDVVKLTGAQSVGGVKTFSSEPVVPTATAAGSPVRKDQYDTALALLAPKAAPALTGSATLDGQAIVKTNDSRLTNTRTPSTGTQYYDPAIALLGKDTTRAAGVNDFGYGIKLRRALSFTMFSVRGITAGSSGNTVVQILKNGSATGMPTVTVAESGFIAGGDSTGGPWAFAANDILSASITSVGTGAGKGLIVETTAVA